MQHIIEEIMDSHKIELVTEITNSMKSLLSDELQSVREEFIDMKNSINFLSNQYEDLLKEHKSTLNTLKTLKEENSTMHSTVKKLSYRIDLMEQHSRLNNIEVQCIPENRQENIVEIVTKLGSAVGCNITEDTIAACSRVAKSNRSSNRPRSIVVQLTSQKIRDSLLAACIKYNKSHPADKLNTSHINVKGQKQAIYVVEHLSPTNKALHAAARVKSKQINYKYVWVRSGKNYMRKDDSSEFKVIKNFNYLEKIN